MRITVRIVQILVALLFIVSGLVKANDPLGLSYKMEEFFEVWTAGLSSSSFFARNLLLNLLFFSRDHSLGLSILMNTLEIVTGIALLIGWRKRMILWVLFVLILFFTFLTGYAYLATNPDGTPKFTNCGCFGDCLPIPPLASFLKDVALMVAIGFLLTRWRHLSELTSVKLRPVLTSAGIMFALLLQWYVLNYLPLVDCLPFKKGNVISEQMKAPKNSTPSVYETRLVYSKKTSGEEKEFSQDEFNNSRIWEDTTWKWKASKTKLVKQGNDDPPIKGFSLTGETGDDSTSIILSMPRVVLAFAINADNLADRVNEIKEFQDRCTKNNVPFFFVSSGAETLRQFLNQQKISTPVFGADFTILRTAARVNPTFYYLSNSKVISKVSYRRISKLQFQ